MIWSVPEVISSLSRLFELYPVDLIFTGTSVGVRQLNLGDRLEGEVENYNPVKIKLIEFLLKFHQNLSKIIISHYQRKLLFQHFLCAGFYQHIFQHSIKDENDKNSTKYVLVNYFRSGLFSWFRMLKIDWFYQG